MTAHAWRAPAALLLALGAACGGDKAREVTNGTAASATSGAGSPGATVSPPGAATTPSAGAGAATTPSAGAGAATAPAGTPADAPRGIAAASPPNVPGGPCYLREVWDECGLIKRLESSGYVPKVESRDAGALKQHFTAPFVALTLGRGKLLAFIYPTVAAAQAEFAKADTAKQSVCPPLPNARYGGTLLHSANLIAVLQADNDNTCVRIGDLVSAGLPKLERR
ncbi:MAG: hypothetical protein HY275_05495 [Gemmatimonadetes bacterium]|nr:hypothetical protein [Gemmatimonadota bacterium]